MPAPVPPEDDVAFGDWLLTLPAFYAELVPSVHQRESLDHLYLMRDCGALTLVSQNIFASPSGMFASHFASVQAELALLPPAWWRSPTLEAGNGGELSTAGRLASGATRRHPFRGSKLIQPLT